MVVNVAAVDASGNGWLAAHPAGSAAPSASTVNYGAGAAVATRAVVALGTGGAIAITNGPDAAADVIVDVSGWFTGVSGTTGDAFHPRMPARIADTRNGSGFQGAGQPVGPGTPLTVNVAGSGGAPPTGADALWANVTVTGTDANGYLTVFPAGSAPPQTSDLNWASGNPVANAAVVTLGSGSVTLVAPNGPADAIVDSFGWFGAPTTGTATAGASGRSAGTTAGGKRATVLDASGNPIALSGARMPSGWTLDPAGGRNEVDTYQADGSSNAIAPAGSASAIPPIAEPAGMPAPGCPANMVLAGHWLDAAGSLPLSSGTISQDDPAAAACSAGLGGGTLGSCSAVDAIDVSNPSSITPIEHLIPVGEDAYGIALSAATGTLYVSNWADSTVFSRGHGEGTVSVVHLAAGGGNGKEIQVIPVGNQPMGIAVSPDGLNAVEVLRSDGQAIPQYVSAALSSKARVTTYAPGTYIPTGWMPIALTTGPAPSGTSTS